MNIKMLQIMVNASDITYGDIDKSSFTELAKFLRTFSPIYSIFQKREVYKKTGANIPSKLKAFFDGNDAELEILSRKTLALADSIEKECNKFRTAEKPSLIGVFGSFFAAQKGASSCEDKSTTPISPRRPTEILDGILKKYKAADKNIALRRAALKGRVVDIELLVTRFEADMKGKSSNGFTALDWAFYSNKMEPNGAFSTLCKLGANKAVILPLVEKYKADDESEFPTKDIVLARALKQENEADIRLLVDLYKADLDTAQNLLAEEAKPPAPTL